VRHLIPALVVTAAVFSTAHAQPAKTSPFSNKSYGDGGGYKHPDAAVGQFFETKPQESPKEAPKEKPEPKPEPKTERPSPPKTEAKAPAAPSRPRPRPFVPVAAKTEAPKAAEPALTAAAPKPPEIKADKPAAPPAAPAAAAGSSLDSASEDARADYEARLFGAAPAPRRQELADPEFPAAADPVAPVSLGEGMLFVSLELDSQEAGALRDAVAGLGSAAAFRPDARFQPLPGAGGSVRISGWLPASRLGDAIARPGVKRVEVERGSRPAADTRVTGDYLLKLRVSDASRSEESIAESVRVLSSVAGFNLDRVLGIETIPGGGSTALVSGTMPVAQLGRALGLPGVIKVSSALPAEKPVPEAPVAPVKKEGFLKFVMGRSLWLVLLTALLALPTVGGAVKKGLAVFVPYR
jgi:hypothetical protein